MLVLTIHVDRSLAIRPSMIRPRLVLVADRPSRPGYTVMVRDGNLAGWDTLGREAPDAGVLQNVHYSSANWDIQHDLAASHKKVRQHDLVPKLQLGNPRTEGFAPLAGEAVPSWSLGPRPKGRSGLPRNTHQRIPTLVHTHLRSEGGEGSPGRGIRVHGGKSAVPPPDSVVPKLHLGGPAEPLFGVGLPTPPKPGSQAPAWGPADRGL